MEPMPHREWGEGTVAAAGGSGRVRVYLEDPRMSAQEALEMAADLIEAARHAGLDDLDPAVAKRMYAALAGPGQVVVSCKDCGKALVVLSPWQAELLAQDPRSTATVCRQCLAANA